MPKQRSTVHQVLAEDGQPYPATGCFNPWIGNGSDVFAMPREGNKAIPLLTGKDYFDDLISSIDAAQNEVLIIGWQVSWDALLSWDESKKSGVRLYDLIERNAKRGVKFYVMPWDDTEPVQTYDDQTRLVLEDINRRLGLKGSDKAVHVLLSSSYASVNNSYFSHHQKCVVVDRRVGYIGGIDLAYGRYDDAKYSLKSDADGRAVLNRYNPCIAWTKQLNQNDLVDPDLMSGLLDKARQGGGRVKSRSQESRRSRAEVMSDRAAAGGWQSPYTANGPVGDYYNALLLSTLNETSQPRMPWQDVHCRIEGPAVADMVRNFVVRWNIKSKTKLLLPNKPESYPKTGTARIQFLRSAPAAMRAKEFESAKDAFVSPPNGADSGIHQAMIRLIENAAHFVYIESQFFVSNFGNQINGSPGELSPVGEFIQRGPDGINGAGVHVARFFASGEEDEMPQNIICRTLVNRIHQAIFDSTQPDFHVYITLPVHPEGYLTSHAISAQVYWTMQSLVNGSHSLLNGIRRSLKAKELKDKNQAFKDVLEDPDNTGYLDIPLEACDRYVTLLNLRSWEKIGKNYVTEQIYIHSKAMVVDDRFAILGSANINDRSLLGERDSEIAVLVIDTDMCQYDIGTGSAKPVRTFARDLRMGIWKKIFGITGNVRPATHLEQAIGKPASPSSWQAIQKQARSNAEAYEKAFPFVPRNWSDKNVPASVLPTWNNQFGKLVSPMPSQEEFWLQPQYKAKGVAGLLNIKGFVTALPVYWAKNENLDFKLPTQLLVRERKPNSSESMPENPVIAAVQSAPAAKGQG